MELLLGDGSTCWLPSLPARRSGHTQSGLVICGGGSEYLPGSEAATLTSCTTLEAGVWTTSHSLQQQRWGHLGWETEGGILLLGGEDTGARRTTELLTSTSSSTTEQYRLSYETRYKLVIHHIGDKKVLLWALIWYWDHLKNFIAEIPQGPLEMSIGTIWVTQKRFQGPPARGF